MKSTQNSTHNRELIFLVYKKVSYKKIRIKNKMLPNEQKIFSVFFLNFCTKKLKLNIYFVEN